MAEFTIGFVIFPGITQLDFTGPFEILSRLGTPPSLDRPSLYAEATVLVIAKSMSPVISDRGLSILPTTTFAKAPALDLICVPGGSGVADAMTDQEIVDFIRRQGQHARIVTSVCTGAFLLGVAGLLGGKKATSHWAYVDLLPLVGATYSKERVVRDGRLTTSTGVTAGMDLAFSVVAELAGPDVAKAIQLAIEYDPSPPFDSGHPDKASKMTTGLMVERNMLGRQRIKAELERLAHGQA